MYMPLQIQAPQTGNAKNPPLNRPSKYKPPGGLYLDICPQIRSKTKQKFKSNPSILKRKFPSVDKPLRM